MSLIDKMKSFIGADEEYEDEMGFEKKEKAQDEEIDAEPFNYDAPVASGSKKNNKVVNIHATTQLQVVLVKPERFDDARTVVLNLESTNKDVARRLVDFLSGVAYANNGQIKRVAASTFIITPYNVDIVGDLLDELESNGVYF